MNMEPIQTGPISTPTAGADFTRPQPSSSDPTASRGALSTWNRQAAFVRDRAATTDGVAREDLEVAVGQANEDLKQLNQALAFKFHEASGQFMVQVVDRNTGEVVRESPPAEFLDLAVRMKEMVGFFLDETR